MAATKSGGRVLRIAFVVIVVLAALQFASLVQVSHQNVRHATTMDGTPRQHDFRTRSKSFRRANVNVVAPSCLKELGKNGTWIQDWQFAKSYGQYNTPLVVPPGPHVKKTWGKFRPSDDAPFRWESSWRWRDYSSPNCQIDYTISPFKLCQVLHSLKVSRVLFFGDSLTQAMAKALLNKMGPEHVIAKKKPSNTTGLYHLHCDGLNNDVQILLAKEGGGHGSRSNPNRFKFVMSSTTREFVMSNPDRTLQILNIGAHYHALHEYVEDFEILLQTIDSFQRTNDLVFLRTTVPGHKSCRPANPRRFNWTRGIRNVPLKHFDEYKPTTDYAWNLFYDYNEHSKKVLEMRRQRKPKIHLLDVFNMTILRQDGHIGGGDCLHYFSPGPVDWWNHLLYTFLKAIGSDNDTAGKSYV